MRLIEWYGRQYEPLRAGGVYRLQPLDLAQAFGDAVHLDLGGGKGRRRG